MKWVNCDEYASVAAFFNGSCAPGMSLFLCLFVCLLFRLFLVMFQIDYST